MTLKQLLLKAIAASLESDLLMGVTQAASAQPVRDDMERMLVALEAGRLDFTYLRLYSHNQVRNVDSLREDLLPQASDLRKALLVERNAWAAVNAATPTAHN